MTITTYRVPQLMSKRITVVCVDDKPICTVRGKEALSRIIARLNGYDVSCGDGRIDKVIDEMKGDIDMNRNEYLDNLTVEDCMTLCAMGYEFEINDGHVFSATIKCNNN